MSGVTADTAKKALRFGFEGMTPRGRLPWLIFLCHCSAFFDYFLEKNILGQILELIQFPQTPKVGP